MLLVVTVKYCNNSSDLRQVLEHFLNFTHFYKKSQKFKVPSTFIV